MRLHALAGSTCRRWPLVFLGASGLLGLGTALVWSGQQRLLQPQLDYVVLSLWGLGLLLVGLDLVPRLRQPQPTPPDPPPAATASSYSLGALRTPRALVKWGLLATTGLCTLLLATRVGPRPPGASHADLVALWLLAMALAVLASARPWPAPAS